MRRASRALARAELTLVSTIDERSPMIEMTTKSSISVKPFCLIVKSFEIIIAYWDPPPEQLVRMVPMFRIGNRARAKLLL